MNVRFGILLFAFSIAAAWGESKGPKIKIDVVEGPNPWSHLEFHDHPDHFQFAIVTDRTGGPRPGVFEDAIVKLNLLQPEFVISVGDLIQGGSTDVGHVEREWDEFDGFIEHLSMPFFYVPGNHDISNPTMAEIWARRHGRAYYHFVYKGVLFLCLNSEDPKFHISDEQIEYFKKVLDENTDVRWTLAFLHRPFWGHSEEEIVESNWHKFSPLLDGRKATVFAGHWHDYAKFVRNDRKHFVLATTGGGSGLRGPAWGEFDHVVWVTMTDDGPVIANLMLEGIWDEDVRNEDMLVSTHNALRGLAVREGSIVLEDPAVERVETSILVENTADAPMHLTGRFQPHPTLKVEGEAVQTVVPPNSVERIPLRVSWIGSPDFHSSGPLVMNHTIRYEFPRHAPMDIEGVQAVTIDRVHDLESGNIKVDGDLSDWGDLPYVVDSPGSVVLRRDEWQGAGDSSFRFGIRADDSHLYLAVRLTDDILVFNPERSLYDRDSVEVWIDTRPSSASESNERWDLSNPPFVRIAASVSASDSMMLEKGEGLTGAVPFAARKGESGFDVELAIPASVLKEAAGGEWERIRLNLGQYDRDLSGRTKSIWWRPRWDSPADFEGSGSFIRKKQ